MKCTSVSDECRSRAGREFHEVGPDEQNARGPMEAVSDLGTKSLLSSEERRCGRLDKVDMVGIDDDDILVENQFFSPFLPTAVSFEALARRFLVSVV